jgi:hypothetical protein
MTWRPRSWLLGCAVASLVAASAVLLTARDFDAEATLEYRAAVGGLGESSWQELLATERVVLRSRSVCERAAARLPGPSVCQKIAVERMSPSRVLRVQASHRDARVATQTVEAVVQAYLERHADQALGASPAFGAAFSELQAQGEELDQLELQSESYAREHGLLTYDAEIERSELALLRQELARGRIQEITLAAELKQLEQAVETRSYQATRLLADPAFGEQKAQFLAMAVDDTADAGSNPQRASLASALHTRALEVVTTVRAELKLLQDQQKELTQLLTFQLDALGQRELDLLELRKLRRGVEEHRAFRDAVMRNPTLASAQPAFTVRVLDHAHVVGKSPPPTAWLVAGLIAALGCAGLLVGPFGRRMRA